MVGIVSGAWTGGLAGAVIGAVGFPLLVGFFVYLWSFFRAPAKLHSLALGRTQPGAPDEPTRVLAEKQLALVERQTSLLEIQNQPHFRLVAVKRSIGEATFDAIELWNDGAPLERYSVWQASYLEVSRYDLDPSQTRYIPS